MSSQDRKDHSPVPLDYLTDAVVLSALPFALCAVDSALRIVYTNAAWNLLLGLPEAAGPVGVLLSDLLPEPERSRWTRIVRLVLADRAPEETGRTHIMEFLASESGEARSLQVIASAMRAGDGPPVGALLTGYAPDTLEMTETQRQAEEAARLEVARQLAATLNHEINNPLFVISATLEDLLAESHDPAMERMLRASIEAVWKVSAAVKQLSEIRRIVTTAYISGHAMIDLEKSQERPEPRNPEG